MSRVVTSGSEILRALRWLAIVLLVWSTIGVALATEEEASPAKSDEAANALATPTHHQTGLIQTKVDGLPNRALQCFCLTPDNRIVAGFGGGAGELRVFTDAGEFIESWSAPFAPEAIYVRGDGKIFLAGEGQLARLSANGEVELQQKAPHAAAMTENLDKVRQEVINQNKQRGEIYAQQAKQYDQMVEQSKKQIEQVKQQLAELDQQAADAKNDSATEEKGTSEPQVQQRKAILTQQLARYEQMQLQYEQAKEQWDELVERNKPRDLTEEEIDRLVKQSVQSRLKASSVSASDDEVFLATRAAVGYGFEVWRMDTDFAGGQSIVSGLSGCCGQMDVKANGEQLFVAENGKHRVCCYDRDGELVGKWGHGARKGIEGFGSCCNPMNVAFGPGGDVYTAEDNTGRIKRYSPDGALLGLVGAVELVPGCKNCSIAVSSDGSHVYMLDITRGHIVRMEPYKPGEAPAPSEVEAEEAVVQPVSFDAPASEPPNAGKFVAKGLLKLLGYGD